MSAFDPSSQEQLIIPYWVCLKWLLLLFSLFNSDDEIRQIPSRWDFHCAPFSTQTPPQGTSCQISWVQSGVGWQTGSAVLLVWASRGKYGQIWSVLSIMSRWNGPDQITNLELITKVVAGLCFILSPTPLSPLLACSCSHLSVFLRGALPSLLSTTEDDLLILFHLITPCQWVRAH